MQLPLLLCGPILRRVAPNSVYIWVALSKRFTIDADLYRIKINEGEQTLDYHPIEHLTETNTIQLGEQLYISLIKITPTTGNFPTQTLLGYNLIFKQDSLTFDLDHLGLLSPDSPHNIVYGTLKYPAFYIHDGSKPNILYGSCRKFHGKGLDSLTSGDLLLKDVYLRVDERPNSLFLLGDQIYADDIAAPLFPIISILEKSLAGQQKNIADIDPRLSLEPFQSSINQIHGRQFIMENFCGFTSNHAHNHLIRFEEYATTYLLSWSPELWHVVGQNHLLRTFEETVKQGEIYFVYPDEERFKEERKEEYLQHHNRYTEQIDHVRNSISTISNIRRLMANIPTYMMFDDHEITDD